MTLGVSSRIPSSLESHSVLIHSNRPISLSIVSVQACWCTRWWWRARPSHRRKQITSQNSSPISRWSRWVQFTVLSLNSSHLHLFIFMNWLTLNAVMVIFFTWSRLSPASNPFLLTLWTTEKRIALDISAGCKDRGPGCAVTHNTVAQGRAIRVSHALSVMSDKRWVMSDEGCTPIVSCW